LGSLRGAHPARALCLAALAVALLLAAPAAAQAAAWLPAEPVSPAPENETGADVEMAANGDVIAVWKYGTSVWAAIRPAGGSYSAPVQISSGTGIVGSGAPVVAVDPAGNAVAAWSQSDGSSQRTRAAFRPAGGAFGPADTISAAGVNTQDVSVAMDAAGNAIAVWATFGGLSRVHWSYRPAGGAFPPAGTSITAGATSSQQYPRLAMDAAGNAVVAYQAYDSPPNVTFLRYQERPAGGVFPGPSGEKNVLNEGGNGSPPSAGGMDVALGGGEIAFAWKRFEGGMVGTAFRGAIRVFGDPQTTGTQILDSSGGMDEVHLVMTPLGAVTAAWSTFDGNDIMWAAREPGSPTFGAADHLAPMASVAQKVMLGLDGLGNAVALWYEAISPSGHRAWVAQRPPGGTVGSPHELFDGGGGVFFSSLSTGGDALGDSFASVGRFAGAPGTRLNIAGYDPVPPRFDALSVPPLANNPIGFSASTFDVWGPVATSWNFGDGSTATGAATSHSFPTPGQTYTVTATATDAAGNASSSSGVTVPNAVPALGRVTMLRDRFAVARAPTPIGSARRRVKRGTAFRYTVSEPARIRIRIDRVLPGRRAGGRCRKPTPRLRKRRACKRYVRAGRTLVRNVAAGRVRTKFSGRIGRRALRPGSYRATLLATDSLGLAAPARKASFRVVRR
jgi:hypothetical protein